MTKHQELGCDVVIVGGGPVGMGLAIELGQRGVQVVVLEKYGEPQPVPKGQNLTQRTMEHLHFWGADKQLRDVRPVLEEEGVGSGLTTYGTLLSEYYYDWNQRALVRPFYFAGNERLPQYVTERVLRARAADIASVSILYHHVVDEVRQDNGGVAVEAAGPDGRVVVRADYAVGCDGSRSVVREQAGITQTRSDHDRLMVLLVFRSPELSRLFKRYPGKAYASVLHPQYEGYWQFFGRVDSESWFFHAPVPFGTTRDNYDFARLLHRAVGAEFDVELEHVGFWELRFAIADTYRAGRLFIAGDAAHSHPPYGGYGINTGFEDARNLGWKLSAVLQGWGGSRLLDSYDSERRPVFASTARDFIAKSIETDRDFLAAFDPNIDRAAFEAEWRARSVGARTEVHSFEPHYDGSPAVVGSAGAPSAVGDHRFEARAGHHLAPLTLKTGQNVYEALGDTFTLLAFGGDQQVLDHFRDAATSLSLPLKVLSRHLSGECAAYEARYVLVRPDHFVAWASNDAPSRADDIVRVAAGHA